jgi:hypothetical protein
MNEPSPSDPEDFQEQLDILRSILQKNLERAKQDRLLGTQLEFWLESAKFLETNIEIWERAGNVDQRNRSIEKMRKVLEVLQQLVDLVNRDGIGDEEG